MMRPQELGVTPRAPSAMAFEVIGTEPDQQVVLSWEDNSLNETAFTVERAATADGPWMTLAVLPAGTTTYEDPVGVASQGYVYRVYASNTVGDTEVYPASIGFPNETMVSEFSNVVEVVPAP